MVRTVRMLENFIKAIMKKQQLLQIKYSKLKQQIMVYKNSEQDIFYFILCFQYFRLGLQQPSLLFLFIYLSYYNQLIIYFKSDIIMRPAESSSVVINPVYKRVAKAVLDNIKNLPQCNKQLIENALLTYQSDPIKSLTQIRTDQATKQFFDEHILEFNCWNQSFAKTVEILNKRREVEGVDILEKIISIQPKIKSKTPHSSYFTNLMIYAKKQLKLDDEFARKWKQEKMKLREQKQQKVKQSQRQKAQRQQEQSNKDRSKQQQKKDPQKQPVPKQKSEPTQQRPASTQVAQPVHAPQAQKQRSSTQSKQQVAIREREKRAQQKLKEIEKMKLDHQNKFKRNKDLRLSNMLKYLDQRKQFTYGGSKDAVAKEILAYLEKFMRDKMEKIIKVTKMRYPGYVSQDAGDQFKMYSNKSNLIQVKHASLLPQTQLKILKVKYPSKLQSYLKLRIQEQRLEQKLKAELKQKMELDKKTDKLIQNYIISDQKQNFTEFEKDQGPKRRQRIFVLPQVIQFVIEADPWFQDMYIMDRTFYK